MSLSEGDIKQTSEFKFDIKGRATEADMGYAKKESGSMMERKGEE